MIYTHINRIIAGTEYEMNPRDGIYIGMGNKDIKETNIALILKISYSVNPIVLG